MGPRTVVLRSHWLQLGKYLSGKKVAVLWCHILTLLLTESEHCGILDATALTKLNLGYATAQPRLLFPRSTDHSG